MNHLDLCSGIGGFALAASWVWEDHTPTFVEIDPYCQKILRKHWPDAEIHSDVKTYDARPLRGRIDLCTGGYPCQPFSMAGKRGGEADDRHLWPDIRRIVEEARPRWCLFENVAGHVTLGLDNVLSDLEGLGYAWQAAVIPACAVDARHRRDRLWIIASVVDHTDRARQQDGRPESTGGMAGSGRRRTAPKNILPTPSQPSGNVAYPPRLQPGREIERPERERVGAGGEPEFLAYPEDTNRRRSNGAQNVGWRYSQAGRCGVSGSGIQHWLPEPDVGRVAHGVPNRVHRLRALGNSIVPQVASEIMRAIKMADER